MPFPETTGSGQDIDYIKKEEEIPEGTPSNADRASDEDKKQVEVSDEPKSNEPETADE